MHTISAPWHDIDEQLDTGEPVWALLDIDATWTQTGRIRPVPGYPVTQHPDMETAVDTLVDLMASDSEDAWTGVALLVWTADPTGDDEQIIHPSDPPDYRVDMAPVLSAPATATNLAAIRDPQLPELVGVDEAARILGVSNDAVYKAVKRGTMPAPTTVTGTQMIVWPRSTIEAHAAARHRRKATT